MERRRKPLSWTCVTEVFVDVQTLRVVIEAENQVCVYRMGTDRVARVKDEKVEAQSS